MFNRRQHSITDVRKLFTGAHRTDSVMMMKASGMLLAKKAFSWAAILVAAIPVVMALVAYATSMLKSATDAAGTVTPEADIKASYAKKDPGLDDKKAGGAKPKAVASAVASAYPGSAGANVPQPTTDVRTILDQVSAETGVDKGLMYTIAAIESSFKTGAKAFKTGAVGLFQWLQSSWDDIRQRKNYASLKFSSNDIHDPKKNATLAAYYFLDRQAAMKKATGKNPGPTEIYLAHLLGTTGASKFLNALTTSPQAPCNEIISEAACKNNKNLFMEGNDTLTIGGAWARLNGKVGSVYEKFKGATPAAAGSSEETAPPVTATPVANASEVPGPQAQAALIKTTSSPQQQQSSPADIPKSPRGGEKKRVYSMKEPEPVVTPEPEQPKPKMSLMRDKSGRMVAYQTD